MRALGALSIAPKTAVLEPESEAGGSTPVQALLASTGHSCRAAVVSIRPGLFVERAHVRVYWVDRWESVQAAQHHGGAGLCQLGVDKPRVQAVAAQEFLNFADERVGIVKLHAQPSCQVARVMRSYTSIYRARVALTTRSGIGGPGGVRSQPVMVLDQSRTNCLSRYRCGWPGCQSSAAQNRDESEVSTSSASTTEPSGARPNSSFVSAMMTPRPAARSAPRLYTSSVIRRSSAAVSAPTRDTPSSKVRNSSGPVFALVGGVSIGS